MVNKVDRECRSRVASLQQWMKKESVDACFVYGDEYRRENLRYVANFWPLFERGAAVIPREGEPIILAAPEGEMLCREMCPWSDIRLVPDFTCVTVPDEIEYPFANYTDFKKVFGELSEEAALKKVGVSGIDAMSTYLYQSIQNGIGDAEIIDASGVLYSLRLKKSDYEVECLRKAASITDKAYSAMLKAARPGVTELELAGIATGEAMKHGAECVPFCIISSGERVNTIIGRATEKTVEDGDMVMAALAVQYEGYVTTFNFPFVVGTASEGQKKIITYLVEAFETAMVNLKSGGDQSELVRAVKSYFADKGLTEYDLYPPLHGCGLSEAESPYPNENTKGVFEKNMTVNTDISIFGHPHGSNRIEAGFVVTDDGYDSMSRLILDLIDSWKDSGEIKVPP